MEGAKRKNTMKLLKLIFRSIWDALASVAALFTVGEIISKILIITIPIYAYIVFCVSCMLVFAYVNYKRYPCNRMKKISHSEDNMLYGFKFNGRLERDSVVEIRRKKNRNHLGSDPYALAVVDTADDTDKNYMIFRHLLLYEKGQYVDNPPPMIDKKDYGKYYYRHFFSSSEYDRLVNSNVKKGEIKDVKTKVS